MELKPGQRPNTTRVIFETSHELYNASRFSGPLARTLYYYGLIDEPIGTKPLPGATVGEDDFALPSESKRPLSNKRLASAASRLFQQSVEFYSSIDTEALAMANTIVEYLICLEQTRAVSPNEPSLETEPTSFVGRG